MRIKDGFVLREVCGEKVIIGEGMNAINFGKLISLNETASSIWKYCIKTESFDENMVVEALCEEYDVERDSARIGVHNILNQWIELGMIE